MLLQVVCLVNADSINPERKLSFHHGDNLWQYYLQILCYGNSMTFDEYCRSIMRIALNIRKSNVFRSVF